MYMVTIQFSFYDLSVDLMVWEEVVDFSCLKSYDYTIVNLRLKDELCINFRNTLFISYIQHTPFAIFKSLVKLEKYIIIRTRKIYQR